MLPEIRNIRARRNKLGLKQKELARLCQVSQSLIAKLESNKIEISYSIAKKIFSSLESLEHKNEKMCSDIMTHSVIKVKKNDSVKKAAHIMKENGVSQLPVIEGKRVIGSISESLIFDKILQGASKDELFEKSVREVMQSPFPIVRADMPLSIVLPLLKSSEAILISEKEKIVGILTKADSI